MLIPGVYAHMYSNCQKKENSIQQWQCGKDIAAAATTTAAVAAAVATSTTTTTTNNDNKKQQNNVKQPYTSQTVFSSRKLILSGMNLLHTSVSFCLDLV